jgi:hypothetical protein
MGKREDAERNNDPMLCSVCKTSVANHCNDCGQCRCRGGSSCPEVQARRRQV